MSGRFEKAPDSGDPPALRLAVERSKVFDSGDVCPDRRKRDGNTDPVASLGRVSWGRSNKVVTTEAKNLAEPPIVEAQLCGVHLPGQFTIGIAIIGGPARPDSSNSFCNPHSPPETEPAGFPCL